MGERGKVSFGGVIDSQRYRNTSARRTWTTTNNQTTADTAGAAGDPGPQSILILRALQLGDLLCAVPAFRALRAGLPEARITLLGLPWARSFVDRFCHYLDSFLEFPGFPGLPEREPRISQIPSFILEVQRQRFDLALQMQGSGSITNTLTALFAARLSAGFTLPGQYCPDPERFLIYPEGEPEIWRHLRLMEFLGIPPQGDELEFPLREGDWESFRPLQERFQLEQGKYACVHPGARAESRRWPAVRFAAVADDLASRGLLVVLTGTREEAGLARSVAGAMKALSVNLAGETGLGALAALLAGARLIVCNDTGVSHLAAALKTPSIVLFSASEPERWAPLDRERHRIVRNAPAVLPENVIEEVETLLNKAPAKAII